MDQTTYRISDDHQLLGIYTMQVNQKRIAGQKSNLPVVHWLPWVLLLLLVFIQLPVINVYAVDQNLRANPQIPGIPLLP